MLEVNNREELRQEQNQKPLPIAAEIIYSFYTRQHCMKSDAQSAPILPLPAARWLELALLRHENVCVCLSLREVLNFLSEHYLAIGKMCLLFRLWFEIKKVS